MISPGQGESYYAQENSYSAAQSVANSQWMGKGAAKLGLDGQVKSADFKNLLHGYLPDGTTFRLRRKEREGYGERAGLDCTFSAPKSASILALAAGQKEIEKAHRQAVEETLKIIEQDYVTTRVTNDGKVRRVHTNNLVAARFHHDTSRELDPHLHTHCVILNLTEHNDRWYSFRNDEIFSHKKLLGSIYRNQLAHKAKELGYSLETGKDGLFEIEGFTPEQLNKLSKRREQILNQVTHNTTWKESERIWARTRAPKSKPIPRKELQKVWRQELGKINYPKPDRQGQFRQENQQQRTENLDRTINEAIAKLGEQEIAFQPEAIQKSVLARSIGKYSFEEVSQAIAANDELIYIGQEVTTQNALMKELAAVRLLQKDGDAAPQSAKNNIAVNHKNATIKSSARPLTNSVSKIAKLPRTYGETEDNHFVDFVSELSDLHELEQLSDSFASFDNQLQASTRSNRLHGLEQLRNQINQYQNLFQVARPRLFKKTGLPPLHSAVKKLDNSLDHQPSSDSEIFEQQKPEKLADETPKYNHQIQASNQSPSNRSSDRLNNLKQLQDTVDYTQLEQSDEQSETLNYQPGARPDIAAEELDRSSQYSQNSYDRLAEKTMAELGRIEQLRLDLEIYLRASSKGNHPRARRILQQSSLYLQLSADDPQKAKNYINAIASVSSTYKQLPENTTNLDFWAQRLVNSNMAKQEVSSTPSNEVEHQDELER